MVEGLFGSKRQSQCAGLGFVVTDIDSRAIVLRQLDGLVSEAADPIDEDTFARTRAKL